MGAAAAGATVAGAASGAPPGPGPAKGPTSFDGYLQYPDSVSASYPVAVTGGTLQAELSWSAPAGLTLSADCPGGTSNGTGASALTLTVPAGSGTCTVTVAEPSTTRGTTSYVLSVSLAGPGPSGAAASGPESATTNPTAGTGAA